MQWIRRSIIGLLGIILILDALFERFQALQFIIGIIMVGLVPVDALVDKLLASSQDDQTLDRLGEVLKKHDPPNGGKGNIDK